MAGRVLRLRRRWLIAAAAVVALVSLTWAIAAHQSSATLAEETARLAELLDIGPGDHVAEIGAGRGAMTVDLARRIGPAGRMYSTEIDPDRLEDIRGAVAEAGLDNVTVIEAGERETNLPPACCDAIFMRNVYHHFTHPDVTAASIRRALRPGGLLAVIDFEPGGMMRFLGRPGGVPEDRRGHGMPRALLVEELTKAGFDEVQSVEDWAGNRYLVLFRQRDRHQGTSR